jgi:large subunit ribosomal protein L23
MIATDVIRRPIITEKANAGASDANRYTFEIDHRATKDDVKAAVAELYKVRVLAVSVIVRKAETRRNKFGTFGGGTSKRAVVKVHSDDRIELF